MLNQCSTAITQVTFFSFSILSHFLTSIYSLIYIFNVFFICERVLSFRLKYMLHLKFSASFDELEFQFDLDIPKSTLCCICTFGKCGCTRNSQNIIQFRERFRSLIQLQIQTNLFKFHFPDHIECISQLQYTAFIYEQNRHICIFSHGQMF